MDKFAENVLRVSIFMPIRYKDVYFVCMDARERITPTAEVQWGVFLMDSGGFVGEIVTGTDKKLNSIY